MFDPTVGVDTAGLSRVCGAAMLNQKRIGPLGGPAAILGVVGLAPTFAPLPLDPLWNHWSYLLRRLPYQMLHWPRRDELSNLKLR